jgi:hypothetical protein
MDDMTWSDARVTPGVGIRYVDDGRAKLEAFVAKGDRWRLGAGLGRSW